MSLAHKGQIQSEETILKWSLDWFLIDPNGKEYHIRNLAKFCRENNLVFGKLNKLASILAKDKFSSKTYKGWKCVKE